MFTPVVSNVRGGPLGTFIFSPNPSIPYLWLLVPKMDPKSYSRAVLGPLGLVLRPEGIRAYPGFPAREGLLVRVKTVGRMAGLMLWDLKAPISPEP